MEVEEYDEVKKWISQVRESTRYLYRSAINCYIEYTGLNPKELIDEAEEDRKKPRREQGKPEQRLAEFHSWLLNEYKQKSPSKHRPYTGKEGMSKMLATTYIGSLRSFYQRNGFKIRTKLPRAAPKKENRKLKITPKEVKSLVDHAPTLRDRAIILFIFQGGFDASSIRSLDYGDVKRGLENDERPLPIRLVRKKEEVDYFTFVGHDAIEALRAYLNDREAKEGKLSMSSPLFGKEGPRKLKAERIKTQQIQNMLKDTALRSGIITEEDLENADFNPARPHALRAGFSTVLKLNGFDPALVDFMQGHAIPYNGAYFLPPEEKVQEMYASVESQLSISTMHPSDKKMEEKVKTYREDLTGLQRENKELREENKQIKSEIEEIKKFLAKQYGMQQTAP